MKKIFIISIVSCILSLTNIILKIRNPEKQEIPPQSGLKTLSINLDDRYTIVLLDNEQSKYQYVDFKKVVKSHILSDEGILFGFFSKDVKPPVVENNKIVPPPGRVAIPPIPK